MRWKAAEGVIARVGNDIVNMSKKKCNDASKELNMFVLRKLSECVGVCETNVIRLLGINVKQILEIVKKAANKYD